MAELTGRVLPREEFDRAIAAGGPLAAVGASAAQMDRMSIAVVEVDGQIVAYWVAWFALHLEPLWIAEAHRGHAGVGRVLLDTMQTIAEATQEPTAFCVIQDSNRELLEAAAGRLGFVQVPGDHLYYMVLRPAPDPTEG